MFKKYLETVYLIFLRPILFFTKLPSGNWKDEPVTFCALTGWIIGFFLSLVIFFNELLPVGLTLWVEVKGWKLILVSPIMVVLSCMFFIIIYSIVGGLLMAALLALFYILGYLLHLGGRLMGGKSELNLSVKDSLYSSTVSLLMVLPALMMIMAKRGILDFTNFKIGYNIVYSLFVLYLYGVMAIASRKTQGIDRWKAFVAALLPAAFLVLMGAAIGLVLLNKIQSLVL